MPIMTTAEATVATLDRARPRHALCAAGRPQRSVLRRAVQGLRPHPHRPHPARAGREPDGARRRARDRQAAGLCGGAGTGPAQFGDRAPHCARHQRAGAGADRPDRAGRDRPRLRPSARDPRPGRHPRAAGRFLRAHPRARRGACHSWQRRFAPWRAGGRDRPRSNARSTSGAAARRWRPIASPAPAPAPLIDEDAIAQAAKRLGAAERILDRGAAAARRMLPPR